MNDALLLETPLISVRDSNGVVWAVVENRDDVDAAEGAECARRMSELMLQQVLIAHSRYRALLFDVRLGPAVFGPQTRATMETMFRAAEQHRIPVAIVVSGVTQRMQFDSMAGIYASSVSRVFLDEPSALEFVASPGGR